MHGRTALPGAPVQQLVDLYAFSIRALGRVVPVTVNLESKKSFSLSSFGYRFMCIVQKANILYC
jgi:hypothetical protein